MNKPILDPCCGSKMFWFDKDNPNVEFCDIRDVDSYEFYPKRFIEVKPDTICDFTQLPFEDNSFKLVVFDPPHLKQAGENAWMVVKYGKLPVNWEVMIHEGFEECMRVLEPYGTLIFKWAEVQIPVSQIVKAIGQEPLFGHRVGRLNNTHWMAFMKLPKGDE